MIELHTYRVHWVEPGSEAAKTMTIRTSPSALIQFVAGTNCTGRGVQIEQLPDAVPSDNEKMQTARPITADDRFKALEDKLRTQTHQRDHARQAVQDHFEEVRALVDAITGSPDLGSEAAERIARETREGRDRLRAERDALIDAIEGSPGTIPSLGACRQAWDMRARLKTLDEVADKWKAALNEIATVVWPNTNTLNSCYALADLVEAVRKKVASGEQAQPSVKTVAYANVQLDEMAAELRKIRAERDALQKRIDAARDRVRFIADSDDRDRLAAILDGRELESKDPVPGKDPKP